MSKNNKWPKMFYHPEHGGYVICENANEVPEGFVDHPDKVKKMVKTFEGPLPCKDIMVNMTANRLRDEQKDEDEEEEEEQKPAPKKAPAKKAPAKKAPAKKAAPKKEGPAKDKSDEVTLESLKLTREEALEILEDEEVNVDDDASDEDIAELVKGLM